MTRTSFLLAGGASLLRAQTLPSEQIHLGVIGAGGRGTFVMTVFQKNPAVRVGAIADVYEPNLERGLSTAAKAGSAPRAYRNYRQLLEDKSIQAVLIATPEHWHHRMVLDALAAGKDVYVEKPLCQTPEQGVELVAAERKTRQIVQVGMQRRSYDLYLEARKIVADGTLGDVRMARCWWLNTSVGRPAATKLDGPLDWEQWQGPAAKRPFDANRFRIGASIRTMRVALCPDQGAHVFDGLHLLMNASYPLAVTATGGRPHVAGVDQPESVVVAAEYPEDFLGVFTVNYAVMKYQSKNDQLNQLDGAKARMDVSREECKVFAQGQEETPVSVIKSAKGFGYATDLHVENFLACVKSRQTPTAPMRLGFPAALVVQMANLSLRQGRRMRWNAGVQRVES